MSLDPRYRTKLYIETYDTPANITKDNGTTQASVINQFEKPPYPITRVFFDPKNVDGIRTIGTPTSEGIPDWKRENYAYHEVVPIELSAVTKQGITADKLRWKMEQDLRATVDTYPLGSVRLIRRSTPVDKPYGTFVVNTVQYDLDYTWAVDDYTSDVTLNYGTEKLLDFGDPLYIFRDHIGYIYETSAVGLVTTTIDASLDGLGNDFWNGCFIHYLTGANAGLARYISDFDDGTDTLIHDAFPNITGNGDTYLLSWEQIGSEDGNELRPSVSDGALDITVAASAGNKVGYLTNRTNLGISTTLYTKILFRYKTSGSAKAKIVCTDGAGYTQTVLADTASSTWTVGSTTLTPAQTLDHIYLYADTGTGHVYYDWIMIYANNFTYPNAIDVRFTPSSRNINLGIPSSMVLGHQNLGADPATIEIDCDLDMETATYDWTRVGDSEKGEVFLDIIHNQSVAAPWQWLTWGNKSMRVVMDRAPEKSREGILTLYFTEYSDSNKATETYSERWNL